MSHDLEAIEALRARYRPSKITTLFVGESAPASGDFFYSGNTALKRHMQSAVEDSIGDNGGEFLERFKGYGWYLDDLVLIPVNRLEKSERLALCKNSQNSLATRIAEYQPAAIVTLLMSIKPIVDAAAVEAGSTARRFAVPFPGMGQQGRFKIAMAEIVPGLPRLSA
jgi:hypothetical protein